MLLPIQAPTPLSYFSSLVVSDHQLPLFEAAASLAQDAHPELDLQQVLHELDRLQATVESKVPTGADPLQRLNILNRCFFVDMRFGGNLNDYYAPHNSYIHHVLHTRLGIPISLAVIWLELAKGLGLQAFGVGFPGHYLVKVQFDQGQVVIDPFTGQSLGRSDLLERLEPLRREMAVSHDTQLALYLRGQSSREILTRMLGNLKDIHQSQSDWFMAVRVLDRLVVLNPGQWAHVRDRGLAHAELGHAREAIHDLQEYLAHNPAAVDAAALVERVQQLRAGA